MIVSSFPTALPTGPAYGTSRTVAWGEFAASFLTRREGEKDGPNFVPARFVAEPGGRVRRLKANLATRTAIALDIEANKETGEVPPPFAEVVANLEAMEWASVVYTSHSHTPQAERYRVVLQLSDEIASDLPAPEVLAEVLGLRGVLDESKIGAASLFYLPSAAPGRLADHQTAIIEGRPVDSTWLAKRAGAVLGEREAERAAARAEASEAAARRRTERIRAGFDPDSSLIERIRDRLDLEGELARHGYEPAGEGRFLYPDSESGVPGVYILTGSDGVARVFSHHAADPLAAGNLPTWCRTKAVDVVDVAAILEFGGDFKRALSALARRFGLETPRPAAAAEFMAEATAAVPPFYSDEADPYDGRKWLVYKALPERGTALLAGQSRAGKTFGALDLSLSLTTGAPFAGHDVDRIGGVLYLAAEGAGEIPVRWRAAKAARGLVGVDLPFLWTDRLPCKLLDTGAAQKFTALAQAAAAEFAKAGVPLVAVIVDTLAVAGGWTDENSNAEAQKAMDVLKAISDATGALSIGIDHHGKSAEAGTRGASAKGANADAVLAVLADIDTNGAASNRRMVLAKCKGAPEGEVIPFGLTIATLGMDGKGRPVTSCSVDWTAQAVADSRKADRLPRAAAAALAVLHEMGGHAAEPEWRRRCDDGRRVSGAADKESRAKGFKRAFADLIDRDAVRAGGGFVWVPRPGDEFEAESPNVAQAAKLGIPTGQTGQTGQNRTLSDSVRARRADEPDRQDTTPRGCPSVRSVRSPERPEYMQPDRQPVASDDTSRGRWVSLIAWPGDLPPNAATRFGEGDEPFVWIPDGWPPAGAEARQ